MIPKIIHQIWIGNNKVPNFCLEYSKVLQENYTDYEIKIWNEDSLKEFDSYNEYKFTLTCIEHKHWGYVVDWYRAKILQKYGGIYLDFDVKFLNKIPDEFLNADVFLPLENSYNTSNYIVGCTKNNKFIKNILQEYKTYNDIEFNKPKWSGPEVYKKALIKTYGRYSITNIDNGKYQSNIRNLIFIDMEKKQYFEHNVSTLENYFKNEQS